MRKLIPVCLLMVSACNAEMVDVPRDAGASGGSPGTGSGGASTSAGGGGGQTGGSAAGGAGGTACSKFAGPCTETVTYSSDGSQRKTAYVYDAAQRLVREESAFDQDGVPQDLVTYSYDEHGWLLESKSSDCDAGTWGCRWFIYTYDARGHVLTVDDRTDYSGRVPGCTKNTYDDNGRLVKSEFAARCLGTPEQVTVYEYDAAGRLLSELWDFGGSTQRVTTYEYTSSGFVAFAYRGIYGGAVEETVAYTRDLAGNPLVEEHRYSAGSIGDDYAIIRTFDPASNQLTERTRYSEGPSAGVDQWCFARTFDECGNRLTQDWWTSRCDQPADMLYTYTYECFADAP